MGGSRYNGCMSDSLKDKLETLPHAPGVYFHKSSSGEVIYVGKAAVLKNRVRQYFQSQKDFDVKTQALVSEIADTDWVETESEIDALFLESEMVKRYMPRYNVLLRDDKSQLFVRIDMKSQWPYVSFSRNPADDGAEYFGPFYNGYEVRKALRYLRRVYPYFVKEPKKVVSKLEMQIGLNPDVSEGSAAYHANLRRLVGYIKGRRKDLARELEKDMKTAARAHDFESAAKLRNRLRAMQELQQRIMFGDREFLDISKDKALVQLAELLGLYELSGTGNAKDQAVRRLRRIEGYDISHQGGNNVVASMVVFTNGVSDRAQYRKFKMSRQVNDDTAQIYETFYRRLGPKNLASWDTPDLMLVDGGKGQLAAAIRAQSERGTAFAVVAIAKRNEELLVHKTGSCIDSAYIRQLIRSPKPGVAVLDDGDYWVINLHVGQTNLGSHTKNLRAQMTQSPYTDTVMLFQRIRDESHRFAVSYHSTLKRAGATQSLLDGIPGVGPATRKKLVTSFGSVRGVKQASLAEVQAVVGHKLATAIHSHLHRN